MKKMGFVLSFAFLLLHAPLALAQDNTTTVLTLDGEPRFEWNKEYYPHVNPNAPKGGTLRLYASGSFDSLHNFIARGMFAAGLGFIYDSLGETAPDNRIFETYPHIAEKFLVAEDSSSIIFYINPKARFHDGKAITAEDVAFSFETLTQKGAPTYKQYYASVDKVEVLSPLEVRFTFKEKNNKELPLILSQLPVLPKHYWQDKDFTKPHLEPPLGSGPYKVKSFDPGSFVEYERVKDYWASELPPNKGRYNFDIIRYEYYRDVTVAREAFKAGAFDLYIESTAKAWATSYTGNAVEQGHIKREEIRTNRSQGMYGFFFNTRRPVFTDIRVREAIARIFDFEWTNRALFYGEYTRTNSYFSNSSLASSGLPSEAEKALLEPYKDQLPPKLLTHEFVLPKNQGDGNIRAQMAQALEELREAGWTMQDGLMKNGKGEKLEFTIILTSNTLQRVILPFRENLKRIGITLHVAMIDQTQYVNRIRAFDYDMFISRVPQSHNPGNEQRNLFTSNAADIQGSRNYSGIKSPVVDALVERIILAQNREEVVTATKALDRVLLWGHYVIPGWYTDRAKVAYWNKFAHSDVPPVNGVDYFSWWVDSEAEKVLHTSDTGYGKQ